MVGTVDGHQQPLISLVPQIGAQVAVHHQRCKGGVGQKRHRQPQLTELLEPLHQLLVLISPGIAAAVERVSVAAQSRFVPVVQTGDARQEVLQDACHLQQHLPVAVGVHRQIVVVGLPGAVLALHRFARQRGDGARGVVGGERVHHRAHRRRRVVFHNRRHTV